MKLKKIKFITDGIVNYNLLQKIKPIGPTELQINITYLCNSRCKMCNIWKMKPTNEIRFEEWRKIMCDPIFKNIQKLTITGGEPTLHQQMSELIKLYIDSMPKLFSLTIVTNGFLTDRLISETKKNSKLCKKRNIDLKIFVSLDGLDEIHNKVRGIKNAFQKTSSSILKLKALEKKYDFKVSAGGLINKINLNKIEEVEAWCKKHKIPFNYIIIGFHDTYVRNLDRKSSVDFEKKDKNNLFFLLKKLSLRYSILKPKTYLNAFYWGDILNMYKNKSPRTTPCPFLVDAFVIDSFGDVYYCLSERKIGNFKKGSSVSEIYFNKKNLNFRKKIAELSCSTCNSGCFVPSGLAKDFRKVFVFYLKSFFPRFFFNKKGE
ncbi:MAG: radical SAM protein [Patescibacteria group bacterium]